MKMNKEKNLNSASKINGVAFIPVRGGSKGIPNKNIKNICGKPLVYWTILAASKCDYIEKTYVSTDSETIFNVVKNLGIKDVVPIWRSEITSSDTATTESAMLEFAEQIDFVNICLIQATSPLLSHSDLNRGFKLFYEENTDSVLSCVRQKRFHWANNNEGFAVAKNYDYHNRPRRQDFDGDLVENGAFYITSKEALLKTKNRISGNIKICEMDEVSYYEIDEPSDWSIVESLLFANMNTSRKPSNIKLFLTDCDGCLTDGSMYYSENGDELKRFNAKDGMGFALLRNKGIKTGIITGEKVKLNQRRAEKLKVDYLKDDCKNKLIEVKKICSSLKISLQNVCFVGDDINDVEVMEEVGFSACPIDAHQKVIQVADYVSSLNGGRGAVRDIIDLVLSFD